jgi:hypothetical protein
MKTILGTLVALSLVAGLAGPADAASPQHKKRLKAGQHGSSYAATARGRGTQRPPSSGDSDYYEHILDKVPFGSKRWWSIYDEQNGTPN